MPLWFSVLLGREARGEVRLEAMGWFDEGGFANRGVLSRGCEEARRGPIDIASLARLETLVMPFLPIDYLFRRRPQYRMTPNVSLNDRDAKNTGCCCGSL